MMKLATMRARYLKISTPMQAKEVSNDCADSPGRMGDSTARC